MATALQAGRSIQPSPTFQAGQVWSYTAPQGFEDSRVLIGAILSFEDGERVVCCVVEGAPQKLGNGQLGRMTIPFLPMAEEAFARTVVGLEGQGLAPPEFVEAYGVWKTDPKGFSCFSVPFEGYLDRLIALQMAEIVGA